MPDFDFDPKDGKWFYMSHEFTDALIQQNLSGTEGRLLLFFIRHAWSWKRSWVDLRWRDFKKKLMIEDTQLSRTLKRLKNRNIIQFTTGKGSKKPVRYKINSKFETWKPVKPFPAAKTLPELVVNTTRTGSITLPEKVVVPIKRKNKEQLKKPPISPAILKPLTKAEILEMDAESVIDFMNSTAGKNFKKTPANLGPIRGRLKEYSLRECLEVAYKKWHDSDLDNKYYRPITLYRPSLFDGYLNETGTKQKPTKYQSKMRSTVEVFARRHYERQNPTNTN